MTDYWVAVCSACLTASCWHGEFMCEHAKTAKICDKRASDLDLLHNESPDNYSEAKLLEVCGKVRYVK